MLINVSTTVYSQYNDSIIPVFNSYPIYNSDSNYNYNYNNNLYSTMPYKLEATNDYDAYIEYEYNYKYQYDYNYNFYDDKVGEGIIKNFNGDYHVVNLYKKTIK